MFGPCAGDLGPVTEVCDGKDNDCDGTADEEPVRTGCELGQGVCAGALRACLTGTPETPCGARSYGPLYEAAEASCDGKDNDCDGEIDEGLPATPCALTAGVCAGATRSCSGGAYPACTAALYLAHDGAYEASEASCDGKDNDCDGVTDGWDARFVSDAGTLVFRNVAALPLPGAGAQRDVLTLYEAGARLHARVLLADGGVGPARFPSTSVASAVLRAERPALASSGSTVHAAWFETLPGPTVRVVVAAAGPQGEALVGGLPGIFAVETLAGPGQSLALGHTSQRVVLAYASLDGPSASEATVRLASCPLALSAACSFLTLGAGRSPALLVEGDVTVVAWDTPAGLQLARLDVPATGAPTIAVSSAFGAGGDHDPLLLGSLTNLTIFSAAGTSPQALTRRVGDCSAACAVPGFTASPGLVTFSGAPSDFALDARATPALLAWEEGPPGQRVAKVATVDTLSPREVAAAPSRRPVPLASGAAYVRVLYDTEGANDAQGNSVLERRLCRP